MSVLNIENLEFPMNDNDNPKFEKPKKLILNVFELNDNVLSPVYEIITTQNKKTYFLNEIHLCLFTKLLAYIKVHV